jgi:hypothetical protein
MKGAVGFGFSQTEQSYQTKNLFLPKTQDVF